MHTRRSTHVVSNKMKDVIFKPTSSPGIGLF
jgi:hypothetical protein